jgi:flagellar biosynthetic protein FliR
MAVGITFVIFPMVGWKQVALDLEGPQLIWLILREAFIGITLGFVSRGFFYAVSAAGEVTSMAMGLSSASLLNPAMNTQGTAVEQLKVVLATLIFLGVNGHHIFLRGLIKSYEVVPLSVQGLKFIQASFLSEFVRTIMVAGLRLSAPVMITVLILNLTMGFVGRAVPQINVLIMSLPVTILAGLIVLLVCLPLFYEQLGQVFAQMAEEMFGVLKVW